jgi:hypothetical protein
MSAFSFRETLMTHLLLWGNGYAQVIRNGRGEVMALYPLMPDRMTVDQDAQGNIFYEYARADGDARTMGGKSAVRLAPSMKEDYFTVLSSRDCVPEVDALITSDPRLQRCFLAGAA